jgi:hypothetical protein
MAIQHLGSEILLEDYSAPQTIQESLKEMHEQLDELSSEGDSGEAGWRCVCHKIQCVILAALKKCEDQQVILKFFYLFKIIFIKI